MNIPNTPYPKPSHQTAGPAPEFCYDPAALARIEAQAERFASLAALAAGMVHSLSNIFAPILISAEILRRQSVEKRTADCFASISAGVSSGTELVKHLLLLSGDQCCEHSECDLRDIARSILTTCRRSAHRKGTFEAKIDPGLWPVRGDPCQLRAALTDLIAFSDFMGSTACRVCVEANNLLFAPPSQQSHANEDPTSFIRFRVTHPNLQIPPQLVTRLFDPFTTHTMHDPDRGFGLSIAYGIVKSHNGLLDVDRHLNGALVFNLYLPAVHSARR